MIEVKYYWAACPEFEALTEKVVLAADFDRVTAELASAKADKEAYAQNAIDLRKRVDALQQRLTAADELLDSTKAELAWQESDNTELRKREDEMEGLLRRTSTRLREGGRIGWEDRAADRIDAALKPAEGGGDE